MDLQTKYRLERDKIHVVQNERFYFSYKITDDESEIHIEEVYIREDLRGNSSEIYNEIVKIIYELGDFDRIIGFIYIGISGSERSLMSLLKFGFKLHSYQNNRIVLNMECK